MLALWKRIVGWLTAKEEKPEVANCGLCGRDAKYPECACRELREKILALGPEAWRPEEIREENRESST